MLPNKQKGVALLTAILIVAVVSASAVYLIDSGYTVMRKTQQRIENEQFNLLANAVETYGIDVLYRDNFFDTFPADEEDTVWIHLNYLKKKMRMKTIHSATTRIMTPV